MAGAGIAVGGPAVLLVRPSVCLAAGSEGLNHSGTSRSALSTSARDVGKQMKQDSKKQGGAHGCELKSSFTDSWHDCRRTARSLQCLVPSCGQQGSRRPLVVCELGGNYEESFADVDKHLLDYFTFKAVKTVLAQLSEMNPEQYSWFYNFVVSNRPQDSKYFVRLLVKERQELGERVMVTRLHLFNAWVKKYNHAQMHKAISEQNLEILRERLIQTVKLTSDGDDFDRPPLRGQ